MMTNDLSKRLRLRNIMAARTGKPEAPIFDEAADLIDQQAAEIEHVTSMLREAVKEYENEADENEHLQSDNERLLSIASHTEVERDEWRRRAEQQRDFMKDTLVDEEYGDQWAWYYFVQLYPEAAQWFEEES